MSRTHLLGLLLGLWGTATGACHTVFSYDRSPKDADSGAVQDQGALTREAGRRDQSSEHLIAQDLAGLADLESVADLSAADGSPSRDAIPMVDAVLTTDGAPAIDGVSAADADPATDANPGLDAAPMVDLTPECQENTTRPCSTGLLGICSAGTQFCGADHRWGACQANHPPVPETGGPDICQNGLDDDCDGYVDAEDFDCKCEEASACPAGAPYCVSGLCAECTEPEHCLAGQACLEGVCGPCASDDQCPADQECVQGVCKGCSGPNACPVGQVCYQGSCCTAQTCAEVGATCGETSDGCGGQLNCGLCSGDNTQCSNNVCVCLPGYEDCDDNGSCECGGNDGTVCFQTCCGYLGCHADTMNCGPNGNGCGGTVTCSCAWEDTGTPIDPGQQDVLCNQEDMGGEPCITKGATCVPIGNQSTTVFECVITN